MCVSKLLESLFQALAGTTGKSTAKVKADYDVEGDLGSVATKARQSQKTMFQPKPLTLRAVFKCALHMRAVPCCCCCCFTSVAVLSWQPVHLFRRYYGRPACLHAAGLVVVNLWECASLLAVCRRSVLAATAVAADFLPTNHVAMHTIPSSYPQHCAMQ